MSIIYIFPQHSSGNLKMEHTIMVSFTDNVCITNHKSLVKYVYICRATFGCPRSVKCGKKKRKKKKEKRCINGTSAVSKVYWRRHATWVWLLLWKPLAHTAVLHAILSFACKLVCVFARFCTRVLLQPLLTSEPAQLYGCVCHKTESKSNTWPSEPLPLRSFCGNGDLWRIFLHKSTS